MRETSAPEGVLGIKQYLFFGFCTIYAPVNSTEIWNGKIDPSLWPELKRKCEAGSLREVAKEYGISHDALRKTLWAMRVNQYHNY